MAHVFLINKETDQVVRVEYVKSTVPKRDPETWAALTAEAEQKGCRVTVCEEALVSAYIEYPSYSQVHEYVFADSITVTGIGALTFERFDPIWDATDASIYAPGQWTYCGTRSVPNRNLNGDQQ